MSEQYDERTDEATEATEATDEVTEGLAPGESPDPELEDQYGEPSDGPDVEDDPRLDAEVTDELSDLDMGVADTVDATSRDLAEADGDEGPLSADSAEVDADDDDEDDAERRGRRARRLRPARGVPPRAVGQAR